MRAKRGCAGIAELSSGAIDGQLNPSERLRLDAHLRACPRCARRARRLGQAVALVRALSSRRTGEATSWAR